MSEYELSISTSREGDLLPWLDRKFRKFETSREVIQLIYLKLGIGNVQQFLHTNPGHLGTLMDQLIQTRGGTLHIYDVTTREKRRLLDFRNNGLRQLQLVQIAKQQSIRLTDLQELLVEDGFTADIALRIYTHLWLREPTAEQFFDMDVISRTIAIDAMTQYDIIKPHHAKHLLEMWGEGQHTPSNLLTARERKKTNSRQSNPYIV